MKVVTVFGTRPEIIRLSCIIGVLDRFCDHKLVHTGQNHDPNLSDIFFEELGVRQPDAHLGVESADGFAEQVGQIITRIARTFAEMAPDRVLILGDTNSGLSAVVAARMRIPVYHLEAGNRCYDDRVPEEINRRVIDHCSSVLMPYTDRSKENLVAEGIERERVFVIGNPIYEVITTYSQAIEASRVLERLSIRAQDYVLVTLHRAENVDDADRLRSFFDGLSAVAEKYRKRVIVSLHPRTADRMKVKRIAPASSLVHLMAPVGFLDFIKLEKNAFCVLSDSGTVQEECCIFGVPNATLRDVTERPETIECGSNVLSGSDPDTIVRLVDFVTAVKPNWQPPPEYLRPDVSSTVARIVLGYRPGE